MSRIEFATEVADDFDRIVEHLQRHESAAAAACIQQIISAIGALEHNPLIGRPVASLKRELIVGRDAHGYVALYSYVAAIDTVFVLAVRSQREAGFPSGRSLDDRGEPPHPADPSIPAKP